MLVFSARIPLKHTVTQEEFLSQLFSWVCKNPKVNSGIAPEELEVYDKQSHKSLKVSNNLSRFEIRHFRDSEMEISACRLTQSEARIIQSYDFVMLSENGQKSLLLQIYREYNTVGIIAPQREQIRQDGKLSSFISSILGKLTDTDDGLPTSWLPLANVTMQTREICTDVIMGKRKNIIPVLYVSKPFDDDTHVEVDRLAKKWQGLIHIVYETESDTSNIMRERCGGTNVFGGNVALYFPGTIYNRRYNVNNYTGDYERMYKKIFAEMCAFMLHQHSSLKYSWDKINFLRAKQEIDKLLSDNSAEDAKATAEEQRQQNLDLKRKLKEYVVLFEEQRQQFEEEKVTMQQEHETEIERVRKEFEQEQQSYWSNSGKFVQQKSANSGFFNLGTERELCEGEAADLLCSILRQAQTAFTEKSHPYALIASMLEANKFSGKMSAILKETSNIVTQAHNLTKGDLAKLEKLGYTVTEGEHYKLKLSGDARYQFSISKTPSDTRSGENLMSEIRGCYDVERKIK